MFVNWLCAERRFADVVLVMERSVCSDGCSERPDPWMIKSECEVGEEVCKYKELYVRRDEGYV